jgi:hypothetical protein
MNDVEKIVLDLHAEWATDPANLSSLPRLFELMSRKYPHEMHAAFGRGLANRQQTISRRE